LDVVWSFIKVVMGNWYLADLSCLF